MLRAAKLATSVLVFLVGLLGCDHGQPARSGEALSLRALEAKAAADAELKGQGASVELIYMNAVDTTAFDELERCRVVHGWLVVYRASGTLTTVHVSQRADGAREVRRSNDEKALAADLMLQPLLSWKLHEDEVVARVLQYPGVSCSIQSGTFFLRMDVVGTAATPVWYTPYSRSGRPLAVDANSGQVLDVMQRPGGGFTDFVLTPVRN
jgi:hypothetical protein